VSHHLIDQFRAFLDHLDASDRSDVLVFFTLVSQLEEDCIDELGPRLQRAQTPKGLRLLILEICFYYPWQGWLDCLAKTLRHEPDLEVFAAGARALGRIQVPAAMAILRELHEIRPVEAFQDVVSQVLLESNPREAFAYHLGRLMEGSHSPRVANEAAVQLGRIVGAQDLPQLLVVVHHEDLLIARHALRLIALVPSPEAAEFLLMFLGECHQETLDDRRLKDLVGLLKSPGPTLRPELLNQLGEVFQPRDAAAVQALAALPEGLGPEGSQALQRLLDCAVGQYETCLVESTALVFEGKSAKLHARLGEVTQGMHQRSRRLGFFVDTSAEGLSFMVQHQLMDPGRILPLLAESYRHGTGQEGLSRVLGQLVPARDADLLSLLHLGPDAACRGAALDALGARRDEAFLPFLLQACRDSIVDLAQRAMLALGQLGGAPDAARNLLLSSDPEDARLGIRIAAINRMAGAVDMLLAFLDRNQREELSLEAIEALGQIGEVTCGDRLLDLLHSGQAPRIQLALGRAVRALRQTDQAISLADKASQLRNTALHALATEALIEAYAQAASPLPEGALATLRSQIQPCWNEKDPWAYRGRIVAALEGLRCTSRPFYEEMAALVQSALVDKQSQRVWSTEQLTLASTVLRELNRRAAETAS
jgi:hypothetical protein